MKPLVYIETSIFSFYYDERTHPAIVVRREWTQEWWNQDRFHYQLVTSTAVLEELSKGQKPHKEKARGLALTLPIITPSEDITEIVAVYFAHHLMPQDPLGDALHLALASYHKCDYRLTWNCQHLANANKFAHLRRINTLLGLTVPALITPLQLLGEPL